MSKNKKKHSFRSPCVPVHICPNLSCFNIRYTHIKNVLNNNQIPTWWVGRFITLFFKLSKQVQIAEKNEEINLLYISSLKKKVLLKFFFSFLFYEFGSQYLLQPQRWLIKPRLKKKHRMQCDIALSPNPIFKQLSYILRAFRIKVIFLFI